MQFTIEEIAMLADQERKMDSGEVSFVMLEGGVTPVTEAAMKEFGLVSGQTINHAIFISLLEFNLAECEAQIAIENAQKAGGSND